MICFPVKDQLNVKHLGLALQGTAENVERTERSYERYRLFFLVSRVESFNCAPPEPEKPDELSL